MIFKQIDFNSFLLYNYTYSIYDRNEVIHIDNFKFTLIGDLHIRKQAPINRKDDFYNTLKEKLKEIVKVGYENQVDGFLIAGDFFDSPMPSMNVVSEIIRIFLNGSDISDLLYSSSTTAEDIKKRTEKMIPIITVAGNHDLYGNSINTLNRTMLGFLINLGIVRLVSKENPFSLENKDFSCAITGTSYNSDIDSEDKSGYIVDEKLGDKHIHIVHGMLSDTDMGKIITHTRIKDILNTKADFTFAGHEHNGFDLIERDNKYFYNSGSITRLSIEEVDRKVKIAKLEVSKEGFKLLPYYLKTAKDGKEVLDLTKKERKIKKEEEFKEYHEAVKLAGNFEGNTSREIIDSLAENNNIKPHIKEKALEMLSIAIEKIDKGVYGEWYRFN